MTDRAVSTVLDVSLAVLLIGAAVLTVTTAPAAPTDDLGTDRADGAADLLGATTVAVNYSLSPGVRRADESVLSFPDTPVEGPSFRRLAHGTLAGLLAHAATHDVTVGGEEITNATDGFERRVANATTRALGGTDGVQVSVLWRPFRGSTLRGRMVVGEIPPSDVPVHAATMNVTSGLRDARGRALSAGGYEAVADVVANATVQGLFHPDRADVDLRRGYPVSHLVAYRYLHVGELVGAEVEAPLAAGDVGSAARRIERALSERFERQFRARFSSPGAAARATRVGTVTITVRTWSQ